jgi:DNA sulfur modification protein DndE
MTAPIEHIRFSQKAREQLGRLKGRTDIGTFNVVCRWAFCASLAEPSPPPVARIPADSNLEMTWRVFAGTHEETYLALLKERCRGDGLGTEAETLSKQFRLHLHRGIGYLAGNRNLRSISELFKSLPAD